MTINREHLAPCPCCHQPASPAGFKHAGCINADCMLSGMWFEWRIWQNKRAQAQAAPEADPVGVRVCDLGYGHAGSWCGPKFDCWLDPRSREERKAAAPQHDAELVELKTILPALDDALETLEMHGRHSDQGYRQLKDWYRKIAGITARIDAKLATLSAKNEGGKA